MERVVDGPNLKEGGLDIGDQLSSLSRLWFTNVWLCPSFFDRNS